MSQPRRIPWLLGLASVLVSTMMVMTAVGYFLAEALPPSLAATLVYFTPAFFLISLFEVLKFVRRTFFSDYRQNMQSDMTWPISVLIPAHDEEKTIVETLAAAIAPRFDLLIAGLVGGTIAFLLARPARLGER